MTGRDAAQFFDVTVDDVAPAAACVSGYFEKYRNVPGLDTIGGTLISAKADAAAKELLSAIEDRRENALRTPDEIRQAKDEFELLKLQCELNAI